MSRGGKADQRTLIKMFGAKRSLADIGKSDVVMRKMLYYSASFTIQDLTPG